MCEHIESETKKKETSKENHMLISFDGFWLHSVTEFDSSQSIIVFNYFFC